MNMFNELLEWIKEGKDSDNFARAYWYVFESKVKELQSRYACQSLKEAGY